MHKNVLDVLLYAAIASVTGAAAHAQEAPGFCEAGYVLADADSDGILEIAEAETLWDQEFGAFDADASGGISAEEFAACAEQMTSGEMLPRNVSPTGSGALGSSGVQVELEGLADGTLSRQEFMDAALSAFDAAGNEEDNQLEWARAFIVLSPDESESDIRSLGRDGFSARASALFSRLDADGDGDLTSEEWVGEAAGQGVTGTAETAFGGLDADASGDVTLVEYSEAGADRFARAREAALAAGWEDPGDYAAGIGTEEGEGEVVATQSEGLAGGEGEAGTEPAAAEGAGAAAQPAGETTGESGGETGGEGGEAGGAASGETEPAAETGGGAGGVPVDAYRFGLGD